MLDYLKSWFWPDEQRRNETAQAEQARKLEMDEPMAGAGAQLAGENQKSETEKSLERASDHRR
jgi:hypothetical protein